MNRLFSVSVDLDGLSCYAAIHGLAPETIDARGRRAVACVALARFGELFAEEGIPATFFAVGKDLAHVPGAGEALARAARSGHEIASHSFSHDYALSRWSQAAIEEDLRLAEEAIAAAVGRAPRGFRAPGYTLSPALLAALRAREVLYDSSLLPSPPYYAAKAAAMALYTLRRRQSLSILGGVGQLLAPRGAHRRDGVRELPIATLPLLRAPAIGTVLLSAPPKVASALTALAAPRGHFNLELHGIDLLDASDEGVPEGLRALQPGLRVAVAEKRDRLRHLLRALGRRARPVRLEDAARALLP